MLSCLSVAYGLLAELARGGCYSGGKLFSPRSFLDLRMYFQVFSSSLLIGITIRNRKENKDGTGKRLARRSETAAGEHYCLMRFVCAGDSLRLSPASVTPLCVLGQRLPRESGVLGRFLGTWSGNPKNPCDSFEAWPPVIVI